MELPIDDFGECGSDDDEMLMLLLQYVEAVEEYRSMLHSVDEHSGQVRTDPLQILHIVFNLNDVLALKPAGVGHTLNDSQLQQQVATCCQLVVIILYIVNM